MTRNVTAHDVYNYVKERLIEKELFPGMQIVEEELAKVMQTSRTTVRSAIMRLHYEGFVTMIPNRGAFIAKPTETDMNSVYSLRRVLETEAVRLAINKLTEDDIRAMEDALVRQRNLYHKYTPGKYIKLNTEFHWIVVEAAENEYLEKFLGELFNKSAIFLTFYDRSTSNADSIATHQDLVDALKARDLEAAIAAVNADIDCAVECIQL